MRSPAVVEKSRAARNRLIEEYTWLVKLIARNIIRRLPASFEFDDLVGEGTLGLIDAAEKFSPERNVPFRAYAAVRIRGQMMESCRRRHWKNSTHLPITGDVLQMESEDHGAGEIMRRIHHAERARIVNQAVDALPDREQKVVDIYFRQERQLAGIGAEFGVRQSRSSQLLQITKRELGRELEYRGLKRAA